MSDAPELPPLPALPSWATRWGVVIANELMAYAAAYGRACQAPLLAKLDELKQELRAAQTDNVYHERAEKAERELADALALCNAANERAEKSERDFGALREQMDRAMAAFENMRPVLEDNKSLRAERDELRAQLEAIQKDHCLRSPTRIHVWYGHEVGCHYCGAAPTREVQKAFDAARKDKQKDFDPPLDLRALVDADLWRG